MLDILAKILFAIFLIMLIISVILSFVSNDYVINYRLALIAIVVCVFAITFDEKRFWN